MPFQEDNSGFFNCYRVQGRHKLKHKMSGMFYMAFVFSLESVNAGAGLCSSSEGARQNSFLQPYRYIFNVSL